MRRKFVEAEKSGDKTNAKNFETSKVDMAIGKIRNLYLIEKKIQHRDSAIKQRLCVGLNVPVLDDL